MLKNQIAVVTGAGSGLGREIAIKLGEAGAKVILVGRTNAKLVETASLIAKTAGQADVFSADIGCYSRVEELFSYIRDEYQGLDILINNAGVGCFGNLEDMLVDEIDQMIATNLNGTIYCSKEALKLMKEDALGKIINIISTAGKRGKAQETVYAATKFGISGFTKSLQQELKNSRIKVSGVYVGGMDTEFWKGIRDNTDDFMSADEVAKVVIEVIKRPAGMTLSDITIESS